MGTRRRQHGKGRVVHNAYGHDRKALMTPNVQKLIARGVEWAATGKVKRAQQGQVIMIQSN